MSDVSKISGNITPNLNNFGNIVKKSISNSVTGLQGMPQDQVTSTVDLSSFVDVKENITDAFQKFSVSYDETATKIANKAESKIGEMLRKLDSYQKEANDWWNNEAKPFFDKAAKNIEKAYIESAAIQTRVDSTAATAVLSVGEGIFKVGEWVVDGGAIVATACASLQTLAIDLGKYVGCKVTNQEFESETAKMWNNTKDFVSNDFVGGAFDKFYDNTKVGNYLKKNSYAFDNTREFGKGFGEAIGVIAISALTFGAGGAAIGGAGAAGSAGVFGSSAAQLGVTAGAVGFGKGSEKAWSDGAGIAEGLATGAATGAWEGFQWFIGGKIGGSNIAGESHKVLNSLSRIVLDGIDGGVEGFTQPVINSIYQKGYYDENDIYVEFDEEDNYVDKVKELYDDNGGWNSVRQGFVMGAAMSALGEVSGGVKQLKNEGKTKPNKIDNDVKIKSADSSQNKNTITFEEYQNMKKADKNVSKIDTTTKQSKVNTEKIEDQIALANYNAKKGRFSTINLNSLDDISLDTLKKVDDVADTRFKVDGKLYSYLEVKEYIKAKDQMNISTGANLANDTIHKSIDEQFKKLNNQEEVAKLFNDPVQYMYSKVVKNFEETSQFDNINKFKIRLGTKNGTGQIDKNYLFSEFQKIATVDDIEIVNSLKQNQPHYTDLEKDVARVYTRVSGPYQTAYLRNSDYHFGRNNTKINNKVEIDDLYERCWYETLADDIIESKSLRSIGIDNANEIMDNLVKNSKLSENLTVYRGSDGLFLDGCKLSNLKPGVQFNDQAFLSTSVLESNISKNSNYFLELDIPKGTNAAYIESITGVSLYHQQELLLGRNTKFEITSYPETVTIDGVEKIKIKAKLVEQNDSKINSTYKNTSLNQNKQKEYLKNIKGSYNRKGNYKKSVSKSVDNVRQKYYGKYTEEIQRIINNN